MDARHLRLTDYVELQVLTHFSLLRGASSPEELFSAAALLGYPAIGIGDVGTVAGVVRAWEAQKATLGVPLFQEQAMKVAIVGAGFTPAEADQLRRAMATFKFTGGVSHFSEKLVEGMVARGYGYDRY